MTDQIINQGDIWWANLASPRGSEPGYGRPVLVVQQSPINHSKIQTIICIPLTSNLKLASIPGNVFMMPEQTYLPKESVANVSQPLTIDKIFFVSFVSNVPNKLLEQVLNGIQFMIGRQGKK